MGAACRAWARGCLLRPDRQGHRLRAGGGRRADRQGWREEPARRLRSADHGKWRRVPHGADVASVIVEGGRATGVRLTSGESISAKKERHLLGHADPALRAAAWQGRSRDAVAATREYRFGKGNFQIHYALDRPPAWRNEELGKVALLHLTPGLDGVSKACNEAARGMLPETADHLCRTAACARSVALPGRQGDPLAAAARSAAPHQGRRRRQARNPGRRQMDGRAARSLCRPRRGDPRQPHRRFSATRAWRAAPILPPTSKR